MADTAPKSYSADPTLYLYTSLTAGSSHVITATSRLETILKANKIPFRALDVATDEKARMLWGRRSKGKKLPGLVKFGTIIGDLEEIEDWNEYGELKEHIGGVPAATPSQAASTPVPAPAPARTPSPAMNSPHIQIQEPTEGGVEERRRSRASSATGASQKEDTPLTMAMRQAGAEAAKKAGDKKTLTLPQSPKDAEVAQNPEPVVVTKLSRAAEDPASSSETTAGKSPTTLSAEGAKRTSVDKITDSNNSAKLEPAQSREETLLQARRTSSITKTRSPLTEGTAAESTSSLGEQDEKPPMMHRGSSVSNASREEIECVEKEQAIPEELEEDDDVEEEKKPESKAVRSGLADMTASNEAEKAVTEDVKPQEQDAKEGDAAGLSVGD